MDSMLKKTSLLRMALAGVLLASGVLLIAWSGIEGGGVELLTVHSASYYEGLARADQWQAGPADINLAVRSSGGSSTSGFAHTQALSEVDGGEEGGSRSGKRGRLSESLIKVGSSLIMPNLSSSLLSFPISDARLLVILEMWSGIISTKTRPKRNSSSE